MKAHDLIHDGLYLIGDSQIVRFYALNGAFYTLDDDFFGNPFEKAEIECFTINKNWLKISPIPLAPEILEKNGWVWASHRDDDKGTMDNMFFRCVGHIYFYSDGYVEADIMGYGIGYNGNGKFRGETNYVHTLQHALRLCGLHDLADNFKI